MEPKTTTMKPPLKKGRTVEAANNGAEHAEERPRKVLATNSRTEENGSDEHEDRFEVHAKWKMEEEKSRAKHKGSNLRQAHTLPQANHDDNNNAVVPSKSPDSKRSGPQQRKGNDYMDYVLDGGTDDMIPPAPLPLTPAAQAVNRQPRGPGAYPHAGVDYRGSHEFTSLEFGEDEQDIQTLRNVEEQQEEGLVTAVPVSLPTETAEPMPTSNEESKDVFPKKNENRYIWISFCLCVLLLVIVGISIAASTTAPDSKDTVAQSSGGEMESSSSGGGTNAAPEAPAAEWEWDLPFDIPNSTLSILRSDPNSTATPQHKAYQWMKNDPYLLTNYSDTRLRQRFAMSAFYYATRGSNWTHQGGEESVPFVFQAGKDKDTLAVANITDSKPWLSYEYSECDWLSFAQPRRGASACSNNSSSGEQVLDHLAVIQNNLQGSLIDEIGHLLEPLQVVYLSGNAIGGTLPSSIGRLTNLVELALHRNQFSGSIPPEIGSLFQLKKLGLVESQLTGTVPLELWKLSELEELQLSGNKDLRGPIMPFLIGTSVPNLRHLQLARNQFSGSLPSSLGLLHNLTQISLHDNRLTGQLPSELGLPQMLTKFYAPNNLLSGPLPAELSQNMKFVNLQGNVGLSGTVPVEWSSMKVLKLEGTSITGTIPEEVCSIRKLSFDCSPTLCGCSCPCNNSSGGSF